MFFFTKGGFMVLWLLCYVFPRSCADVAETKEETRPYEFSFNIVDFQHRYEKKDTRGIITGEYGFITADGVYHETGYATDENGDFVITRMRNRKITGLKDALEIFGDRPEAAKKLVEAVAKACGGCKIPIKQEKPNETARTPSMASSAPTRSQEKLPPVLEHMVETVTKSTNFDDATTKEKLFEGWNEIPDAPKDSSEARRGKSLEEGIVRNKVDSAKKLLRNGGPNSGDVAADGRVPEKMANELHYRFNYTITSHEHQEDGYRSGKKDGSYRAQSENGVDTRVRYLSNEFGHQPNISFVPRANKTNEPHRLKGYSFLWYRS